MIVFIRLKTARMKTCSQGPLGTCVGELAYPPVSDELLFVIFTLMILASLGEVG